MSVTVFRIDDVSVNTDQHKLLYAVELLRDRVPECKIMLAVSVAVFDMSGCQNVLDRERVFPRAYSAASDNRAFFRVTQAGAPSWLGDVVGVDVASHGIVHADHRLMSRECQELSIVTSCSLLDTHIFVPPFNKYDSNTVDVCAEHGVELIKFEHGWKHVKFNQFSAGQLYYFHPHDLTVSQLTEWLKGDIGCV